MAGADERKENVQNFQTDWEDFGQKVDLTQRIREVLANYPEGTTILKELIQNADDSGASKVIVCLDRRQHGIAKLAYGGLAPFQGPALLVYNNSVFTEEDFESISRVGGSKKRTQAGKTGRFGIGFNVVYHLTDLPSFVSGQHLVYFDPHCAHLPRVSAANPGKRLDFVRVPAGESHMDQFTPYKVFGCDMVRPFKGTLFRFPLRTPDLASVSRISRQAYSVQGMSELLSEFKSEAIPSLLFLKNVESIKLFDWGSDASGPTQLFTCELQNRGPDVHRHRQVFSQIARSPLSRTPVSDVYSLDFRCTDEEPGGGETHESYLISQYMAGSDSPIGAIKSRAEREYDLYLLPWTSIAARLGNGNENSPSPAVQGRAFCFLPLPMTTNLPVHVNGYFELSSNRRDLWMGLDMEGSGRLRSEWNRTLLSDVCTAAYTQLLLRAAAQLGPSSTYYALFPASKPDHPWSLLVTRLYESLTEAPILHTRAVESDAGGQKSDGRWVAPRQALYKDEEFARGAALTSALVSEGLPVVEPPLGARSLLLEHSAGGDAAVCTPALVRARLRGFGRHGGLERREDALTLLEYCLEDVLDDEAGDHLVNLPLVPLSDGLLGKFAKRTGASGLDYVLASSEIEERILGSVPHRLVDETIAGALGERIRSIAQSGTTNVRLLSAPLLGALLAEILPLEWRGEGHVAWEVLGANAQLSASEQEREVRLFTQRDAALKARLGRRVSASLVVPLTKQCSVNWLAALWQWLGEHSRADVKDFSDWPLLPVSDGGLCQLSLSSAVIGWGWEALESGTATNPPENAPSLDKSTRNGASSNPQQLGLVGVLRKLGCKFLHPGVIPVSEHPLASQFVHPPTALGILKALSAACERDRGGLVSQRVANLNLSERSLLRRFFTQPRWWSGAPGLPDSSSVNILRSLPIFETFSASADMLVALVSSRVFLPPKGMDEALLGDSFLQPESESEARILAGPLGVLVLGKAAFYRSHVFGRILGLPADVRDRSMLAALRDLPGLCSEDPTFREIISRLPFVPAGGQDRQELLPPSALYDPRVEELLLLLEGGQSKPAAVDLRVKADPASAAPSHQTEADTRSGPRNAPLSGFFPTGNFATPQALDALRYLGLKASVSQETILAAARAVEFAAGSDSEAALVRGRAILEYLEVHGHRWMPGAGEDVRKAFSKFGSYLGIKEARATESGLEKFWSELSSTQWCPVMVAPPDPGLPWPTVTGSVSAPRFCRPASDTWLVSASLRILDGECRSASLANQMGWDKPPGPAVLAAQLLELGKRHLRVGGRAVGRQLAAAIPRIYTLLHQLLGREEMEIVKAVLEGCSWVWVGDGFAPVDQVAFTGPLNLAPYLFVVPSDLSAFRELLSELGVREALAPGDYARVLARMAADTDGRPLQDGQLSMAIWLVQQLADAHLLAEDARSAIHVPDAAGVLAPAGELVYNDAPWLEGFGGSDGLAPSAMASSSRFVHAKVSHEVAERVGVRSLRRLLLAANADSMDLAVGTAEAFGQHEALTVRLKHIVEMYADGPGILCELVQNADDAGATSVSIVLDREQYGTSSILSPRMATWQGPALLCYNDALFTPRDLHNISRIGQDSKLEKPAAIGRFGLGFNSVYHLTDVPSFVSGDYLVIFDPHASHLPGVSPSHPGLKIGFVGRGLTQQFPDQFRPYVRFGCDLQHHFPGTLFRFPLRTQDAVRKSEIKQEPCDLATLTELLYSFRSTATEALLFLRSVRSISVYIRDKTTEPSSENLKLLYKVERAASLKEDPQQAILNFIRGGGRDVVASKEAFLLRLQRAPESALPWGCARVDILTTGPPQKKATAAAHVHSAVDAPPEGESTIRADADDDVSGGATSESGSGIERAGQSWLVCNKLGGGRARAHALAPEARGRGFVPWAGVAARLDAEIQGRAFCFLPLPVANQLPVHANGYFELSSNRRDIWQGTDHLGTRSNIKSEWNTCLLEDVAAPAYAQLLVEAAKQLGPTTEFSRLWPVGVLREPWSQVAGKLYEAVVDLPVLPTKAGGGLGRWITPRQAVFPDFSFPDMGELGAALVSAGMPLVDVTPEVCVKFQQACPSLRYLTPQLLRRQLTIAGGRKPKLTDRTTVVLALRYCLQGLDDDTSGDLLGGLPLLPLADGSLGTFGRPSEAPIFVATAEEYRLFASEVPQLFLEQGPMVSEETQKRLGGLAACGATNLRLLDNADVASILLPRMLPADWKGQLESEWRPPVEAGGLGAGLTEQSAAVSGNLETGPGNHPSTEWLARLWKWLAAKDMQGLEGFSEWPLLPTSSGMLCSLLEIDPAPAGESVVGANRSNKPHSTVIRGEALSEGVSGVLLTAGCHLLRTDLVGVHPVLNKFVHSSTATGVLGALAEAALRKGLPLKELVKEATHTQRQEVRAFLCQSKWFAAVNQNSAPPAANQDSQQMTDSNSNDGTSLSASHLRNLASLPIFEAYTGVEATTASVNRLFVDLTSKQRFFPPPGVPESLLSENFLRSENENERTLLSKHLGVESLGRAAFYLDHVFGRSETLATEVGRRAMLTLLSDLPSLSAENPGFTAKLTRLAFVPTGAGTLAAPADLYDPGVNELHTLLDRGAFFPSEEFQRPEVLEVLRGLGLRKSMGRRGLLDSARSVEMKSGSDLGEAVKRGRALLQHLDDLELEAELHVASNEGVRESAPAEGAPDKGLSVNRPSMGDSKLDKPPLTRVLNPEPSFPRASNDLEEDAFWSQLAGVSWCPVLVEAPDVLLPWRNLGGPLAPSKFVRPKEDAWLVSSGLRLLDGEVKSANLKRKLGWGDPPGANVLAGQLLELGRKYPQVEEEGLTEDLRTAVLGLYSALEEVVGSDEFEVVKASLEGSSCVWVGNGFVPARSIAFESPANFHPYLYTIPSELASYRRLLEALEVRERFAARDYAQLLFRMARDSRGEPLPDEQLNVVFRVLDVLADDPGLVRGTSVLLPDKAGRLCRADDLVFNDAAWLAGDGETGPRLVHPDVQNEVAEKLGARSLRYLFLVDQEMTSDVPCPGLALTRMVNDDRKLVLFDLLEVADVAGARRVEVLVDGREHPRQSLLQPNLAPFQGAAIVVRMDGPPLTVQELSALFAPPPAKLRGRSCSYGSGLLSCFGVTDLPFIASGGLLYMFDPQGEILTASLNGSTGRRKVPTGKAYSLDGTDLVTRFSDQLLPLGLTPDPHSGLQVTPTEGTVIRLPLRDASEGNPGGLADVREALEFFQEHLASSLLFLRAVEEVAVKVHAPGEEAAKEVMRCSILPQHVELRQPFQDQQKKRSKFAISSLFGGQSSVVRTNRIAVRTSLAGTDTPFLDEWLVVQALGAGKTRDMSLDRKYLALNLIPVGGVAAHVMRDGMPLASPSVEHERRQGGLNKSSGPEIPSDARHEASEKESRNRVEGDVVEGHMPEGEAIFSDDLGCSDQANTDKAQELDVLLRLKPPARVPHGSAIHLELPISAGEGLPVILSGHFLPAKTTSGRQLFQRGVNAAPHPADSHQPSQDFLRLNWNRELLSCVREAYIELLVHLHRATHPYTTQPVRAQSGNARVEVVMVPPMTPERLYSYWPKFTAVALTGQPDDSVLAESLVRPMYGLLAQMPLFLLQTGVRAKIGEGMFLAPPAVQERQGGVPPASVLQFLHQHYQVFAVPWEIRDELHGAGVSTSDLTPHMLRSLLRSPTAAVQQSSDSQQALVTQVDLLEYCCVDLILKPEPAPPEQNGVTGQVTEEAGRGERLPRSEELGRGEQEAAIRAQAAELQRITRGSGSAVPGGQGRGGSLVSGSAFAPDIDRLFGAGSARAADNLVAAIAGAISSDGGIRDRAGPAPVSDAEVLVLDSDGNAVRIDGQKVTELIGIRCPAASGEMLRLGGEAFLATPPQEALLPALAPKFVHSMCLQRGGLSTLFSHPQFRAALNLRAFTPELLAANLGSALPKVWAIRGTPVIVPWDLHPHALPSAPSPDWLSRLWKEVGANEAAPGGGTEDLPRGSDLLDGAMFGRWHLLPAVQGSQTVLVRGDQKELVFYPSEEFEDARETLIASKTPNVPEEEDQGGALNGAQGGSSDSEEEEPLIDRRRAHPPQNTAIVSHPLDDVSNGSDVIHPAETPPASQAQLEKAVRYPRLERSHPWLLPLLRKMGAPVFDARFRGVCERLVKPPPEKNLAQLVLAHLGALHRARIVDVANSTLTPSECDSLLSLFAASFAPDRYTPADVTILKSLPIYKTANADAYVSLLGESPYCTVPPAMFLKPRERVLEYRGDTGGLYGLLGVKELTDADVMAEHALPEFGSRSREERDRTLGHLRAHWARLKQVPAVVSALKETPFVPSASPPPEGSEPLLHKPSDLLDPSNALLRRVFFDEPARFAGGEFASKRWLPILREAGLKSSMDGNLYLECGKKIEARAKEGYQGSTPVQPFVTEEERRFRRTDNQALAQAPVRANQPSGNPPSGAPGSGEIDRELLETAGLLMEKMLGEFANVYGPAFCEAFSQIACVPAERIDFKTIGAAGGASRRTTEVRTVLASYRESVLTQDWPLAWSSAPVLKDERVIPPAFAWGALKLRSPPAYSVVIAHLKILGQNGGEDVLARWGGITGARTAGSHVSVEDAYLAVFRFLYSKWEGLSVSEREMLRGVPFIPVANGTRLVAPERLYARARTDLAPFAFELPRAFTPYLRILEVLGTGDAPTPDGLLKLIAQVAHTAGGERLNPNELHAVLRILTLASEELNSTRVRTPTVRRERIVVPDEGARLLTVDDVICADAAGASLLNEIDCRKVRLAHPLLPEDVAVRLGVRKLSESVEEELDQAWFPEQLPSLGAFTRNQLAARLQSPEFINAAIAVVHSHATAVPSLRQITRRHLAVTLAGAADGLRLVKSLSTRLVLLPNRVDITLREEWPEGKGRGEGETQTKATGSGDEMTAGGDELTGGREGVMGDEDESRGPEPTESQPLLASLGRAADEQGVLTGAQSRAYSAIPADDIVTSPGSSLKGGEPTSRDAPRQRTVYEFFDRRSSLLFIALPPRYLPLQELFSGALSRLLGSPVTLPLGALLFAPGGDVVPLCRALRVPLAEMTDEEGARQRDAQRSGAPGERLLPQDLPLVQCHPLRPYHAGEVVAWQPGPRESGVLRYGRVAEDVRAPSGQALYHVAVETSPGHVQDLLSSTVFSFRSASSVDGGPVPQTATPSPSANAHSASRTGPLPQEADNQTRNGNMSSSALGAALTAGGAAATAGSAGAPAGAPRPQVKPSEVVQAVHDMLAAANLPLGLEEGALMERALGLQEQLGAAESLLEGAETRVAEVQREAEAAKGAWTCKVCLGEEVTSALVPCGHLFCTACGVGVGGRCPFCRRPASSILRIYKP